MITRNTAADEIKGTIQVSEKIKVDITCINKNEFKLTDQNNVSLNLFHNEELGFYTKQKTNDMVEPLNVKVKNEEMINILSLFRENLLKENTIFPIEDYNEEDYNEDDYNEADEDDEVYEESYHQIEDEDDDEDGFY